MSDASEFHEAYDEIIARYYADAYAKVPALGADVRFYAELALDGGMLYIRPMTDDVVCDLASRECVPCRGGIPPLTPEQRQPLLAQLSGWQVVDGHHLKKEYTFKNFVEALAFVNRVAVVAEHNGHHPDLYLTWGKVRIEIYTYKIDGLTESDFVLAAKCDQVL